CRGDVLSATSVAIMARRHGGFAAAVHRAELIEALRSLVGPRAVTFDARCTSYRNASEGAVAVFQDGWTANGDVLVGADGLRSVICEHLVGQLPLRYAGYPVWRGIADFHLREALGVPTMGPDDQFGCLPMTRRRVYWFASVNAAEGSQS